MEFIYLVYLDLFCYFDLVVGNVHTSKLSVSVELDILSIHTFTLQDRVIMTVAINCLLGHKGYKIYIKAPK